MQEQVDEYEYIGPDGYGYPIYADRAKADGYDDENPYEGIRRDPRLYRDIRYHGSWYAGQQLNTASGDDAVSGSYLDQASHTGYYLRKLMNSYIQRERRVEFFYENDRYWTARLYMEPDDTEQLAQENSYRDAESWPYAKTQRFSHGMKPVEDPDGKIMIGDKKYKMKRIVVNDGRVFSSPRSYFWPIYQEELKRCPSLVQNPGW